MYKDSKESNGTKKIISLNVLKSLKSRINLKSLKNLTNL